MSLSLVHSCKLVLSIWHASSRLWFRGVWVMNGNWSFDKCTHHARQVFKCGIWKREGWHYQICILKRLLWLLCEGKIGGGIEKSVWWCGSWKHHWGNLDGADLRLAWMVILQRSMLMRKVQLEKLLYEFLRLVKERGLEMMNTRDNVN